VAHGDLLQPITITSQLESEKAIVSVHNHGAAIPPSLMPELFEPMTRGAETGSNRRSVGLGLYIVKEIAKAHGGQVSASSSEEDGTVFTVCFPLTA
jgi:sigma-B regulation protein RsbU (phosphoserine phosphatase)